MSNEIDYFLWGCWAQDVSQDDARMRAESRFGTGKVTAHHVAYIYATNDEEYEEYQKEGQGYYGD